MKSITKMAKNAIFITAGLFSLSIFSHAHADALGAWHTKKLIRIIAVFPPGGSVDQISRIPSPVLQTELKQNVIVENIGSASGVIGIGAMTRSDLDGYTFAIVFDAHRVNPILKNKLPILTESFES
jgi:tripartite-type tricarboxylate transporter receptor subunit TctC